MTRPSPASSGLCPGPGASRWPLNRVCNVDGVCAACRLGEEQFGAEDLEGVVKSNILMVEMARSSRRAKK